MQLSRDDDTVEVHLHANECHASEHADCETGKDWVKVKRRLSHGDRLDITAAAISFRVKLDTAGKPADSEIAFGGEEYKRMSTAGLVVGIKEWSFPVPVTQANIQRLDSADAELITQRCNLLWDPPRTDDETGNSSAPSSPPSGTEGQPQPSSSG